MKNSKKNNISLKNKTILGFSFLIFIVSISLILVGFSILSSPKNIMLYDISNLAKNIENKLINNTDLDNFIKDNDIINIDSIINIATDNNPYIKYNEFTINSNYVEDKTSKESYLKSTITSNNTNIFNVEGYLEEDNSYVNIENITNGFLKNSQKYVGILDNLTKSKENYAKLMNIVTDSIINNTKNSSITKTKEEITNSGTKTKVTKLSYDITGEVLYTYIESIIEDISKDKDLNALIIEETGLTKDEILKEIESLKNSKETLFTYNVYYEGFNHIVMSEIELGYYVLDIYRTDDSSKITLRDVKNNFNYLTININNNELIGTIGNVFNFEGTIDKNIKMTIISSTDKTNTMYLEVNNNLKEQDSKLINNLDITLDINMLDVLGINNKIELSINNTYSKGTKIDKTPITNYRNMSDLTTDELDTIYLVLSNKINSLLIEE